MFRNALALVLVLSTSLWAYLRLNRLVAILEAGPRIRRLYGARMLVASGVWQMSVGTAILLMGGVHPATFFGPLSLYLFGGFQLWLAHLTRRGFSGLFQ
jgi:hypothetical protein